MIKNTYSKSPPRMAVRVNTDPTETILLSELLRKTGLELRAFNTAEAALADMSDWAGGTDRDPNDLPALIVADLHCPGTRGSDFRRLLRSPEYATFNQVPLLVVSSTFSGEETSCITTDLGDEAFLSMPVDCQRFIKQVQVILSANEPRFPLRVGPSPSHISRVGRQGDHKLSVGTR